MRGWRRHPTAGASCPGPAAGDEQIDTSHPLVDSAGRLGELPSWARCSPERRAHSVRVGDLMASWALDLGHPAETAVRWRAAGVLHDALKDAGREELRELAGDDWPAPVAHGPACAERLRREGVSDQELLNAVAYHPVGHPGLTDLGEYLMLADYLEPQRTDGVDERARLRAMLPEGRTDALTRVLSRRIERLLRGERRLLACTVDMWNRVVRG